MSTASMSVRPRQLHRAHGTLRQPSTYVSGPSAAQPRLLGERVKRKKPLQAKGGSSIRSTLNGMRFDDDLAPDHGEEVADFSTMASPSSPNNPPSAAPSGPGEIGPAEQAARQLLARLGARWVPMYPNSKVRRTRGSGTVAAIPPGNAEVRLPPEFPAFDVDSPEGGEMLALLMQDWPQTLLLRARRGPRAVYRLPEGVRVGTGELVIGLEILHSFLSPGSWFDGVYYTVLELREPATLPQDVAERIAEVLPAPPPTRAGKRFVVEDVDPWGRAGRQQRLRGSLVRRMPSGGGEDALR